LGHISASDGLEEDGIAVKLTGGFAIITMGDGWVETYAMNIGSMELMFTAARSGSSLLPNASKAFHGKCRPGK
jgi:hypothetical protein